VNHVCATDGVQMKWRKEELFCKQSMKNDDIVKELYDLWHEELRFLHSVDRPSNDVAGHDMVIWY